MGFRCRDLRLAEGAEGVQVPSVSTRHTGAAGAVAPQVPAHPGRGWQALGGDPDTHKVGGEGAGAVGVAGAEGRAEASRSCHWAQRLGVAGAGEEAGVEARKGPGARPPRHSLWGAALLGTLAGP